MTARREGAAPVTLTRYGAQKLIKKINDGIDDVLNDAFAAWEGRIWEVLPDVTSWTETVDRYLPRLKNFKFDNVDARRDAVAHWAANGAPQRDMAAAFNVSNGTIAADVKVVVPEGGKTISRDGSVREQRHLRALPAPAKKLTFREKITFAIADAGSKGMTRKELCRYFKADGGAVSGALTPLHKSGRLIRTDIVRDDCYAYLVAPVETEEDQP